MGKCIQTKLGWLGPRQSLAERNKHVCFFCCWKVILKHSFEMLALVLKMSFCNTCERGSIKCFSNRNIGINVRNKQTTDVLKLHFSSVLFPVLCCHSSLMIFLCLGTKSSRSGLGKGPVLLVLRSHESGLRCYKESLW